jgi:hypothetical protein
MKVWVHHHLQKWHIDDQSCGPPATTKQRGRPRKQRLQRASEGGTVRQKRLVVVADRKDIIKKVVISGLRQAMQSLSEKGIEGHVGNKFYFGGHPSI